MSNLPRRLTLTFLRLRGALSKLLFSGLRQLLSCRQGPGATHSPKGFGIRIGDRQTPSWGGSLLPIDRTLFVVLVPECPVLGQLHWAVSDACCSLADGPETGKLCWILPATFRARLCVARRLLPKKRTLPSTRVSRTTLPSRVQS